MRHIAALLKQLEQYHFQWFIQCVIIIWVHLTLQFAPQVRNTRREIRQSRWPGDCTASSDCVLFIKHLVHLWQGCYCDVCCCSILLKVSIQLFIFCKLILKWIKQILGMSVNSNSLVKELCWCRNKDLLGTWAWPEVHIHLGLAVSLLEHNHLLFIYLFILCTENEGFSLL